MAAEPGGGSIDSVLQESRVFPPNPDFAQAAHVRNLDDYQALWNRAKDDPEGFWGEIARDRLHWFKPFDKVLEWNAPYAKWFVGGQTNAAYNCLDRHLDGPRRNKAAIIWEGEPGDRRVLTLPGPPPRGLPVRQRAEVPRHPEGRPSSRSTCR